MINKLNRVQPHWHASLRTCRRAYFTNKAAAERFKNTCCNKYILSAPLGDWYRAWVVFYD